MNTNNDDEPSDEMITEVIALMANMPESEQREMWSHMNGSSDGFANFKQYLMLAYKEHQH